MSMSIQFFRPTENGFNYTIWIPVVSVCNITLHFNGHFSTWIYQMSPFWILLEIKMMEVVVKTQATIRAKLQSNHHYQQTNT